MSTPAELEETPEGLVARETLDGAVARVARTCAAAEDDAIRRQLVALGWTPPGASAPPAPVPPTEGERIRTELSGWLTQALALGHSLDGIEVDLLNLRDWIETGAVGSAPDLAPAPAPPVAPEAAAADQALAALVEVAKIGLPLEERRMVDEHAAQIRAALTALPVVPEAAVEAFKAAWHKADDEGREGERVRDGLAAALPFLTAAPSATRDEVARTWIEAAPESGPGAWDRASERVRERSLHRADALLASFAMTRREDR